MRLLQRFAHDRNDLAEMLAGGEFGHHAAVFAMNVDLRGDDARKNAAAAGDHGSGRFVARGFDAENQVFVHGEDCVNPKSGLQNRYVSMEEIAVFESSSFRSG